MVGSLTSPAFTIDAERYTFLLGGESGTGKVGVELLIGGQVQVSKYLKESTVHMRLEELDTSAWFGHTAQLRLVDSGDGFISFDAFKSHGPCNSSM